MELCRRTLGHLRSPRLANPRRDKRLNRVQLGHEVISPGRNEACDSAQDRYARRRGIYQFFSSLAEDCGHKAIGVVLSGAMSDGTLGLEAIKAAGGITFAQNDSAQHDSMPRSAVASGCVDFVLPPNYQGAVVIWYGRPTGATSRTRSTRRATIPASPA